jgi:hypothetical protein
VTGICTPCTGVSCSSPDGGSAASAGGSSTDAGSACTQTTLATDTFQRADQTYWGTASDGQAWSSDASNNLAFSINGNAGNVAGSGNAFNAILGPTATDSEVLFTGSLSSFGGNMGAVLRWTDTNDWYKAHIDGTNLVILKKVSGASTNLSTIAFPATGNTSYSLRFRVVGNTLYAKVWASSGSEPSSWAATVTDSSLANGHTGLRMVPNAGVAGTFTSFQSIVACTSP